MAKLKRLMAQPPQPPQRAVGDDESVKSAQTDDEGADGEGQPQEGGTSAVVSEVASQDLVDLADLPSLPADWQRKAIGLAPCVGSYRVSAVDFTFVLPPLNIVICFLRKLSAGWGYSVLLVSCRFLNPSQPVRILCCSKLKPALRYQIWLAHWGDR